MLALQVYAAAAAAAGATQGAHAPKAVRLISAAMNLSCYATGHVPQILGPKNAWTFTKWANTYGPLYKLHILDHFLLMLTDPSIIAEISHRGGKCVLRENEARALNQQNWLNMGWWAIVGFNLHNHYYIHSLPGYALTMHDAVAHSLAGL